MFQCRAENTEDSIDAAAVVDVLVSPKFISRPEDTLALEKGDVTLDCSVYGRPQVTVQWYKNGDLIVESDYFQVKFISLEGAKHGPLLLRIRLKLPNCRLSQVPFYRWHEYLMQLINFNHK